MSKEREGITKTRNGSKIKISSNLSWEYPNLTLTSTELCYKFKGTFSSRDDAVVRMAESADAELFKEYAGRCISKADMSSREQLAFDSFSGLFCFCDNSDRCNSDPVGSETDPEKPGGGSGHSGRASIDFFSFILVVALSLANNNS